VVKHLKKEVRRLAVDMKELADSTSEKFDPQRARARELQREFAAIALADSLADDPISDRRYFAWLQKNIPILKKTCGRYAWFESKSIMQRDETLLKKFEETLQKNINAQGGKAHLASQKTYADLTVLIGNEDSTKRSVMRARRRQKDLTQSIQEILDIAALAEKDRIEPPSNKEYKRRRKRLLEALRRITATK
jgi:hypothetical protein